MAFGYSLLELMFVMGLTATISGIAVPQILAGLDDYRATGAARYLSTRLQRARMEAVMRSTEVGVRFTETPTGYTFAVYADGNRNGIRAAEIASGTDPMVMASEQLTDNFRGVEFGTLPALPAVDPGGVPPGGDPIRLGTANMATFTPLGTSSSGSLYVRSQRTQLVVRIFAVTGKTRVLKFDIRTRQWKPL